MTISTVLTWSSQKTIAASVADILLAHILKKDKAFICAHPEYQLTDMQTKKFKNLISRRVKGEPVAYLTGHKEFYGLDFKVDKRVLIPRPETELMVEEIINQMKEYLISNIPYPILLIDLGTGSGCLPIAVFKNLPVTYCPLPVTALATDISKPALSVARQNARQHHLAHKINFLHGNLLHPILNKKCLNVKMLKCLNVFITANLPYLPNKIYRANYSMLKYEPRLALIAKNNGLYYYQKLINQIKLLITHYSLPVTCFFELLPFQTKPLSKFISKYFPMAKITIKKDLAGKNRLVVVNFNSNKNKAGGK